MDTKTEKKLMTCFSRVEPQKLLVAVVAGGLLVAFFALSRPYMVPSPASKFLVPEAPSRLSAEEKYISSQHIEEEIRKPICDSSNPRFDICEAKGDIRIHGNSSSIHLINPSQIGSSSGNESWRIKPHGRKGDIFAMSSIRELTLKSLPVSEAPICTVTETVPAIVFSIGGYMGNAFHDFTDILIPLFITCRQFNGEVQFLIADMKPFWVSKYQSLLKQLSKYDIVNLDDEKKVLCYRHVIVGLNFHKEMSIDPSKSPAGYSMVDFGRLMRSTYIAKRDVAIRLGSDTQKKPRLMIIARKYSRSFMNVDEIARMVEESGFEAVIAEASLSSDLAEFAHVVNSCDVLMGVHGAGMTNLVFLPMHAVVIQVVPLGRLEGIAWGAFGQPTLAMNMSYIQYQITPEESSLSEKYPKDHPVLKDPASVHKGGWLALREKYLVKQNVRLDVERFKPVLLDALRLLH